MRGAARSEVEGGNGSRSSRQILEASLGRQTQRRTFYHRHLGREILRVEAIHLVTAIFYQNVPNSQEVSPQCELETGLLGGIRPSFQVKVLAGVVATDQRRALTTSGWESLVHFIQSLSGLTSSGSVLLGRNLSRTSQHWGQSPLHINIKY